MKPIETREDVQFLVHTFYSKIRKDELLGPIFNSHISEMSGHTSYKIDRFLGNEFIWSA